METVLFVSTVIVTITWSVWNYLLWTDKSGLSDDSLLRLLIIIGPSAYFLLLILAGWPRTELIRLDLISFVILDGITLLCAIALLIFVIIRKTAVRGSYIWIFVVYNACSAVVVIVAYVLRGNPILLSRLSVSLQKISELNFFSFAWVGIDAQTREQDLTALLNRLLIAVLSYLPVGVIRVVSASRQRSRIRKEIGLLKQRVTELESRNNYNSNNNSDF